MERLVITHLAGPSRVFAVPGDQRRTVAIVLLIAGLGVGAAFAEVGWSIELVPWVAFIAVSAVVCWFDVRTGYLPGRVAAGGVAGVLAGWILVAGSEGSSGVAPGAAGGAVLGAGILLLPHLTRPGSLGLGDVKFALTLGAVLGPYGLVWIPFALLLAQALQIGAAAFLARRRLPFTPALATAALAGLVLAHSVTGGVG